VSSTFLSLNLFGYPAQWCAITNLFVRVCLTFIVIHFLKIYARYCIYEIQIKKNAAEWRARGELGMPEGMAVSKEGNIFLSGTNGVQVLSPNGNWLGVLGKENEISAPTGLHMDLESGALYAVCNNSVVIISKPIFS
jgi:hypothetical protein